MEDDQTFYTEKQKYESSSLTAREVIKGYYNHTLTAKDGVLLKHNVEPYAKLLRALRTRNGTALINHATGTGKSYIVAKYLVDGFLDTKKPILFLGPNNSVLANFDETLVGILGKGYKKHLNITFSTYQNPKNYVDKKYSCIVCDEAHHIGAKVWLKSFQNLISNNIGADVIGLTATMERTDNFDITQVFGNPISRLPVLDAYNKGILTPPLYTLWQINYKKYGDETDDLTARIQELQLIGKEELDEKGKKEAEHLLDIYKKIQRQIPSDDNLGVIISKSLDTASSKLGRDLKKGKIIIFCPPGANKETSERYIESIVRDSQSWFGGVEMNQYVMHSNLPDRENEKTLQQFRDDKSDKLRIMFNIGMLTEGVHVSGIDAVVMLRPTNSSIIYLQQLGRISSAKSTTNLVIDCVCNAINMSNGDFYTNIFNMLSTALSDEQKPEDNKDDKKGKDVKTENQSIEFFLDQSQVDIFQLLQNANMEYQNFRADYFLSPIQELIKYIPVYMEQHPESCERTENGVLKLKDRIKGREVLILENGAEYPIGERIRAARRAGRMTMTDEERKVLEDFGIDFSKQKDENPAQTLIERLPMYMEQHPEKCKLDDNGVLKLKEQIKQKEMLILENEDEYPIGRQISEARLGKMKMTDEEWKQLEDFGIDFTIQKKDMTAIQELINNMLVYMEHHPEKCYRDENGVLKLKEQIKVSEVLILENEDEYPIGQQISQARLGKMKMTDEECKVLEDFGMDFSRQKDENPAQTLIDRLTLYMEQHPENCEQDENGVLKLKEQIKRREVLVLENGEKYRIGQRISEARSGRMTMTDEERKVLEDFGIDFSKQKDENPAQTLIERLPMYMEQHPEKCKLDDNGVLKLKEQIKQKEMLILENGEKYRIGQQVSLARLGKIKMTDEERKILEEFGIDFTPQRRTKDSSIDR